MNVTQRTAGTYQSSRQREEQPHRGADIAGALITVCTVAVTPRFGPARRIPRVVVMGLCGIGVVLLLAGCAAGANPISAGRNAPGFWLGLWQGFIAPLVFVISLFNHGVGIYEVHNSGAWYDFGFLVGLSVFFSGPAGAHRHTRAVGRSRS